MIKFTQRLGYLTFIVGMLVAGVLMIALMMIGFWDISKAVLVVINFYPMPEHAVTREGAALAYTLKGLEFLFISPLGFLTLLSLANYVNGMYEPSLKLVATRDILEVKSLIISLMVAIVFTDLISKILSEGGLSYKATLTGIIVIVVLGTYLIVLHRLSNSLEHQEKSDK